MTFLLALTILGTFLIQNAFTEKIIFFHHMASYSHRVQTWPLAEALSRKGHEVTYISPFYPKEPNENITELVPKAFADAIDNNEASNFNINLKVNGEMLNMLDFVFTMGVDVCRILYTSPEFLNWLEKNPTADLVIIDNCFAECGTGLAYKLGAKYIYFSTVPVLAYEYDTIGFLPQSSAIPETETNSLTPPLSFIDRIGNALESLRWRWGHYHYAKRVDDLIRTELEVPDMPQLEELIKNPSLIFYTGDVISDFPRSLPPLYVNIAGIHTKPSTKPLPKELEDFINSKSAQQLSSTDEEGFIYISLGALVVSSNLPQYMKNIFFDVIKSFPHIKFLWKWNGDLPESSELPENLYLSSWFNQAGLLSHPKIRGFITQCGRPSIMEAIFNGVSMIAFPIIVDQEMNADRLKEMGAAVRLNIATMNYNDLRDGVEKVLYDSKMKARMSRLREIFLDRPMSPLETALWYTDYVLRNEDTAHLRPVGNDQYWFVRRQIDVIATLSIGAFVILVILTTILVKVFRFYFNTTKSKNE